MHRENKPWFYEHAAKLNKSYRDTFIKPWSLSHLTAPGRPTNIPYVEMNLNKTFRFIRLQPFLYVTCSPAQLQTKVHKPLARFHQNRVNSIFRSWFKWEDRFSLYGLASQNRDSHRGYWDMFYDSWVASCLGVKITLLSGLYSWIWDTSVPSPSVGRGRAPEHTLSMCGSSFPI